MTKEGTMRSTTRKKGISLTLDVPLLEWLEETAEIESLSVSYLVNRFCSICKEVLDERIVFPDKEQIRKGLE